MHPLLLCLHIYYFIDMSFPAQMQVNRDVLLPNPQQLDTDRIVRLKCQAMKEAGQPRLNLLRQYRSINPGQFDCLKVKFTDLLANIQEGDNPNIEQFMPLVLGVLEGTSGTVDPMLLLIDHFGHNIENIKIEDTIKERTKVLYYGVDKRKEMSVRQTDKKTLESMADLFDIKEIKNHRKICQGIRNYIKALKKFVKAVDASTQPIDITTDAYKAYVDFVKEELDFNQLKIPIQETMIDQNQQMAKVVDTTPAKEKPEKKKEDTASTHKNKDKDEQQANHNEDNSKPKDKRARRTKEEVEREKILKEQEKQAKKREKEEKEKAKLEEKEREKAEKAQKERQKQLEKERERKAKQEEKQAKQREKQEVKETKERQRQQKQAEKRRLEEEKQKKNTILKYFPKQKTDSGSPSKQDAMKDQQGEADNKIESNDATAFLNSILSQNTPLQQCKQAFFQNKMKDQASKFDPYYVNIVTHKSRLEFTNFLVTEERLKDYTEPHGETQTGKYEDSSAQYEDLCGDMCSEENLMSAEEEVSQENSAIVPDGYFEIGQLSQQSKDDVVVNIDKGGEWYFSSPSHERAQTFQIYCLYDEILPITLSQPEQSNELPISMKCDLYKEIHGFHGTKDALIKALALIADKMPRSYLDNLIKETTTKAGSQRIVKPEIIEYINQQKEGFSRELEEIKARRDEEIRLYARQRVNQKEKQIQRLILEEAGTYYIVDLLQFLREKGFKMTKRDLNTFIEGRVGPHWDDIRRRMKKMQVKEVEKMSQFLKKDRDPSEQDKSDPKNEPSVIDSNKMQPQ